MLISRIASSLVGHARRVFGLHDALDGAILGTDDPAVAGRVELRRGEDRGRGGLTPVRADQPLEQLGRDQRVVPRHDDDRARVFRSVASGEHRGAGALSFALLGHDDPLGQVLCNPLPGADHTDDLVRAGPPGSVDHPLHHRLAADGMQDLGQLGAHARAAPGSHDEHGEGLGHGLGRVAARWR